MLLTYSYKGQLHKVFVHWTADTGKFTVFGEIVRRVSNKHQIHSIFYQEQAALLDSLVDKLYKQIYIFIDEYEAVPFDPRFRRVILRSLSEISERIRECVALAESEHEILLTGLFMTVEDKLRELVDVYLAERAYQSKFRERLRDNEQYIETTPEHQLSCDFEDVLLQMTEISRQMNCLSETQRRRLVQHIFLQYTLQEIADHEHVSKQSVQESIAAALKRIRQRMD